MWIKDNNNHYFRYTIIKFANHYAVLKIDKWVNGEKGSNIIARGCIAKCRRILKEFETAAVSSGKETFGYLPINVL